MQQEALGCCNLGAPDCVDVLINAHEGDYYQKIMVNAAAHKWFLMNHCRLSVGFVRQLNMKHGPLVLEYTSAQVTTNLINHGMLSWVLI